MKKFSALHPVIFEILLILAGFVLALIFSFAGRIMYFSNEVNMAIGRILAGSILMLVFIRSFHLKKTFTGIVLTLPALLFAVWNVFNCFVTGNGTPVFDEYMIILALAPAIFEEVIFRGIFINNLKASGKTPMMALIISAVLFGATHLTNIVGMPPAQVLVQTAYSVVVGLVFGAIYIRTEDILSLMIAHFAIDFTSNAFPAGDTTPVPMIIAFLVLMIAGIVYAILICRKAEWQQ